MAWAMQELGLSDDSEEAILKREERESMLEDLGVNGDSEE